MSSFYFSILAFLFSINIAAAQNPDFTRDQKKVIKHFFKHTSGVYNNRAQANTSTNPLLKLSEIRAFRIWTHKKDEYWFSIGWYLPDAPSKPMGEKIFHIKDFEKDHFVLECYSWKDPSDEKMHLQWRKKHPYQSWNKDDLIVDDCTNYLTTTKKGCYVLKTQEGEICAFKNPMAPFDGLYFHFIYNKKGKQMDIYDKNYKNQKILFHYVDEPMLMRKVKSAL